MWGHGGEEIFLLAENSWGKDVIVYHSDFLSILLSIHLSSTKSPADLFLHQLPAPLLIVFPLFSAAPATNYFSTTVRSRIMSIFTLELISAVTINHWQNAPSGVSNNFYSCSLAFLQPKKLHCKNHPPDRMTNLNLGKSNFCQNELNKYTDFYIYLSVTVC